MKKFICFLLLDYKQQKTFILFLNNFNQSKQLVRVVEGNNVYYYDKDATGAIIGIVDTYKDYVVKYTYTAYGEVTKQIIKQRNVSTYNSFLYNVYYYDVETEYIGYLHVTIRLNYVDGYSIC